MLVVSNMISCPWLVGVFCLISTCFLQAADPLDTWTASDAGQGIQPTDVDYFKTQYIVTVVGQQSVLVSSNATTWTKYSLPNHSPLLLPGVFSIGHNEHTAVIGGLGQILSSKDGVHWTEHFETDVNLFLDHVVYGNGRFVVSGDRPGGFISTTVIFTSTSATNWTEIGTYGNRDVAFGEGKFAILGYGTTVRLSEDASPAPQPIHVGTNNYSAIGYGKGIFVAAGKNGAISISTNGGTTWTEHTPVTTNNLLSVRYGGGYFIAVGEHGTILTSTNGVDWKPRPVPESVSNRALQRVVFGNGRFVVVGNVDGQFAGIMLASGQLPFVDRKPWLGSSDIDGQEFGFEIQGPSNANARIQISSDLSHWDDLVTISHSAEAATWFKDTVKTNIPGRFYRVAAP